MKKIPLFLAIVLLLSIGVNGATITSGLYKPGDTGYTSPIKTCTFDECAGCIPVQTRSCEFAYNFRNNCTDVGWFVGRTSRTNLHSAAGPRNVYYCGCRNNPTDMGDCPDTNVCNGNWSEVRDYSCSPSGACSTFVVVNRQNCETNENNYCQNGIYYSDQWGCTSGSCSDDTYPDEPMPLSDTDGDGFDNRCDLFPNDPCSIDFVTDNCNNLKGIGCPGCILGNVTDSSGARLSGVIVQVIGSSSSAVTNTEGSYSIMPVSPGTYTLSASKNPFAPSIQAAQVYPTRITSINFTMGEGSSTCEQDCTHVGDELCHQECFGLNGCAYYNSQAASTCNNQRSGFRLPFGDGMEIKCCEGSPYPAAKIKATTQINSSNVIRIVRNAIYEGKVIKVVIDVFD